MTNNSNSYSKFSIQNFRVFERINLFDFRPITFLIGPNSSGKSSLMKVLKSINKSAINSRNYFVPRRVSTGEFDNYSSNIDFINSFPNVNECCNFSFDLSETLYQIEISGQLSYEIDTKSNSLILKKHQLSWKDIVIFKIDFLDKNGYVIEFHYSSIIQSAKLFLEKELEHENNDMFKDLKALAFNDSDKKDYLQMMNSGQSLFQPKDYDSSKIEYIKEIEEKFFQLVKNIKVDTREINSIDLDLLVDRYYLNEIGDNGLSGFFKYIFTIVKNTISKNFKETFKIDMDLEFSDLGNFFINDFPKKIQESQDFFLHKKIAFLHAPVFKRERTKIFDLNDKNGTTFDIIVRAYIAQNKNSITDSILHSNDYIDHWLSKFNIGQTLVITSLHTSNQYFTIEILKENNELISISDLGYGAGQVLSYIMLPFFCGVDYSYEGKSYSFDEENILKENEKAENHTRKIFFNHWDEITGNKIPTRNIYLEEPETNLHPNWQSILAELFAFQISIGLRFVIETHSEYMIRKIQTLIAKSECNNDDVIVHYFNSEHERNQNDLNTTREIKINRNGTLSESFGTGFFDEAGRLSLELLSFNSHSKN